MVRKEISKRIRFEVFKRDSFSLMEIITEENADSIKEIAKYCGSWSRFRSEVMEMFGGD